MQCTAKSKRTGQQCKRAATPGKQVCRSHGGKTPSGIASPHFKTGRYSKVIPTHLTAQYEAAQQDPDLLGIKEDIALQDALLRGALDAMSRGEAGELWEKLDETWKEYRKAKNDRTGKLDPNDSLNMIGFLIKEGYQDYMARIELRQMLQERAKLVEAEGKRLERAQQTLNTNQAMSLAQALLQAVLAHVSDRTVLADIQGEFVRLVGAGDSRRIEPS
jgi:acyl-CoA thioesterase FadM